MKRELGDKLYSEDGYIYYVTGFQASLLETVAISGVPKKKKDLNFVEIYDGYLGFMIAMSVLSGFILCLIVALFVKLPYVGI